MVHRTLFRQIGCATFVVYLATPGTVAIAQTMYTVTDLGTLGGDHSHASGISDADHVVGSSQTGETDESGEPIRHAFLWEQGVMMDLGTLGGLESQAHRVNSTGQVVGWSHTPDGVDHAFIWLPESAYGLAPGMNDLGTTGVWSVAWDLNESAQVVGRSDGVFLWLPEPAYGLPQGMNPLNSPWTWGWGVAINDLGQVVSSCWLWLPETTCGVPAGWNQACPLIYDIDFWFFDINNRGLVLQWVVYAWSGNMTAGAIDLDPCSKVYGGPFGWSVGIGWPLSINDRGDVVGLRANRAAIAEMTDPSTWASEDPEWAARDLNAWIFPISGFLLSAASDINESGEIVGFGTIPGGETHGYLLVPVDSDFDDDEDTDLTDFGRWRSCLAGPDVPVKGECADRDIDCDGDVDLVDFFGLQRLYTGPR
jgi:probable HAF family extracellular repeat protein